MNNEKLAGLTRYRGTTISNSYALESEEFFLARKVESLLATTSTEPAARTALPARRFASVSGFVDADYVEFPEGEANGGGVLNGVPHKDLHYTRAEAEECVRNGVWREVPIEASASPVPRAQGGNTNIGKCQICVCGQPDTAGVTHRTDGLCTASESPDSAHIAPQAAADTRVTPAMREALSSARAVQAESAAFLADTGAVDAAGVDEDKLLQLISNWAEGNYGPELSAFEALTNYIDGLLAQQREAGRRETFKASREDSLRVLKAGKVLGALEAARQPVSEGLTEYGVVAEWPNGDFTVVKGESIPEVLAHWETMGAKIVPLCVRSAVPPAKAEGLNTEQIEGVKHIKAMAAGGHDNNAIYEQACAILAQQAKGATK